MRCSDIADALGAEEIVSTLPSNCEAAVHVDVKQHRRRLWLQIRRRNSNNS